MSRRLLVPVLVAVVVLAGCSGGVGQTVQDSGGGMDATAANDRGVAMAGEAGVQSQVADGGTDSGGAVEQVRNRQLIRTATVELRVADYTTARETLADAARQRDGFVSDSTQRRHTTDAGNYTTGTVTFRVPADRFDAFVDRVESGGTVISSQQNTEDVTDQLVDIQARLQNLRTQRDRLRTLYSNANETEEVLQVENRLSEVQTQIERLEAQKASLDRQVALSTVTVELREPRPEPAAESRWYDTPLIGAFAESVHGVVVVLRASAVAFAYAFPYLVVFLGPPAALLVFGVRRWRARRTDTTASATDDAE